MKKLIIFYVHREKTDKPISRMELTINLIYIYFKNNELSTVVITLIRER